MTIEHLSTWQALIMIMNDFVDLFFEGAKIANYAELKDTSTGFYMAFVVTWFVLRQVYCPLWILWTSYQEAWRAHAHPAGNPAGCGGTLAALCSHCHDPAPHRPLWAQGAGGEVWSHHLQCCHLDRVQLFAERPANPAHVLVRVHCQKGEGDIYHQCHRPTRY